MFDYHGRVAVITGGSSGLGVLCANALAARGCDVVLAARRFEILEKNAQDTTDYERKSSDNSGDF